MDMGQVLYLKDVPSKGALGHFRLRQGMLKRCKHVILNQLTSRCFISSYCNYVNLKKRAKIEVFNKALTYHILLAGRAKLRMIKKNKYLR